jgi:UDP-galactopyranose mutase
MRFVYDNNYFNDRYQGIPIGGYTQIVEKMLEGIEVRLNTEFTPELVPNAIPAKKILYTGTIDSYFDYKLGKLEYRSLKFETERLETSDFQGNAVVNYTDDTPFTRIIEHKHFEKAPTDFTIVTREYPANEGDPFYPVNDSKNQNLYAEYKKLAENEGNVIFGGRLGNYKYYDMDDVIKSALEAVEAES